MEPTNQPTQNSPINPEPAMPPVPETPAPVAPEAPVAPTAPTAPVEANPPAPAPDSTQPAVPEQPANPTPVAPIVQPGQPSAPVMPTPVNPVYQPGGGNGLVAETDPITMPEQPKAPDPIEEELKAPFKAAEPVPGSIGSAVSGPQAQTPNVSFDDPAMADNMKSMATNTAAPMKKKMDRKTLIILCAIVGVVVLALAVVLAMQLMGIM